MKIQLLKTVSICSLVSCSSAFGASIFQASNTNTNVFTNVSADVSANGNLTYTGDTATGTLSLGWSQDVNIPFGIASTSDIQTLNGGVAVTVSDMVTLSFVIDGVTVGDLQNIGFEIGLNTVGGFRGADPLLYANLRGNQQVSTVVNSFTPAANDNIFAITENSLVDGFALTMVIDNSGYTITGTGIIENGVPTTTSFTETFTFTGTEFLDNINTSHLYFTAQRSNAGNTGFNVDLSTASIDVSPVPEPSSVALVGLGALSLLLRRSRK